MRTLRTGSRPLRTEAGSSRKSGRFADLLIQRLYGCTGACSQLCDSAKLTPTPYSQTVGWGGVGGHGPAFLFTPKEYASALIMGSRLQKSCRNLWTRATGNGVGYRVASVAFGVMVECGWVGRGAPPLLTWGEGVGVFQVRSHESPWLGVGKVSCFPRSQKRDLGHPCSCCLITPRQSGHGSSLRG
jgi:hypothetical protein